ncbi:allophanate hydrolase-related protein [Kocuria sediminis]|uniref:allophanate hydrolase-related protein n=1 Tax=Kocuria sediminis TaxID=1038857 RepID=UPI001F0D627E|nr:hypothetical protein [Kocuria sediminis]
MAAETASSRTGSAAAASSAAGSGAPELLLVVAGAHLRGQPLHHQLTERSARFVEATTTAPEYRMFALDSVPAKPGVLRVPGGGAALAVEVWALDAAAFGTFVAGLPAPMAIGRVRLGDGRELPGFLVEPFALEGAEDITAHGGWAAYREASV